MSVFQFLDYKEFVLYWVRSQPKRGYGVFKKISIHLNISTVQVSQIFKGNRDLTMDHAFLLSSFIGLTDLESQFFKLLVEHSRASHHPYKKHLETQIQKIKVESIKLKKRLPQDAQLSKEVQSEFYSDWIYTAVRLSTAIDDVQTVDDISHLLNIPKEKALYVINFLLEHGLIIKNDNQLLIGPSRTHLDKNSAWAQPRRVAWRMKAIERMSHLDTASSIESSMHVTLPMAISEKDYEKFKSEIANMIADLYKRIPHSNAEKLYSLCIDFFKL